MSSEQPPSLSDTIQSLDKSFMIDHGYTHQNYDALKSPLLSLLQEKDLKIKKLQEENKNLSEIINLLEKIKEGKND